MAFLPAWAPVALAGIGTVTSTIGAIQQGKQNEAAANYNAEVEQNYATAQEQQAQIQAQQDARQTALLKGTIIANAGASGGTGQGSALDVLGDTVSQGTLQQQNDIYSGQLGAMKSTNSAKSYQFQAANAMPDAMLNASSKLFSGAQGTYDTYNKYYGSPQGQSLTHTG